ncbi:hypothetical protein ACHQM5_006079 [Ranunculus cassubicifolius]
MELGSVRDAFDHVDKKQKLSSSKTQEVIDHIGQEVEDALNKFHQLPNLPSLDTHKSILLDLNAKVKELSPLNQLDASQKDLNHAYRHIDFDTHTVNQIIASHFFHQGQFDLGDLFIHEANEPDKSQLMESQNLDPAIEWAGSIRNGPHELKLHRLKFVQILQKGKREDALIYARTYLSPFASSHMAEIQKLMATLLWAGKLECSPYADLLSPTHLENITEELTRQFCQILDQTYESPLTRVIDTGAQGLPTLLKLANVMAAKKQEWLAMKQLPVKSFSSIYVFVCPVSRDQASDENPPMLMPCGHVLCKQSIVNLVKGLNVDI